MLFSSPNTGLCLPVNLSVVHLLVIHLVFVTYEFSSLQNVFIICKHLLLYTVLNYFASLSVHTRGFFSLFFIPCFSSSGVFNTSEHFKDSGHDAGLFCGLLSMQ